MIDKFKTVDKFLHSYDKISKIIKFTIHLNWKEKISVFHTRDKDGIAVREAREFTYVPIHRVFCLGSLNSTARHFFFLFSLQSSPDFTRLSKEDLSTGGTPTCLQPMSLLASFFYLLRDFVDLVSVWRDFWVRIFRICL